MSRLSLRPSGTSPSTMRRARPSTMAVLPTPGSPMSTGLFLVRRDSTWMTRRISSSRPMTGSSLPWRALGEVAAVLLERLVLVLGVLAGDPVAAAHLAQRGEQLLARDAEPVGRASSRCSPSLARTGATTVPSWLVIATSRWSGVSSGLDFALAWSMAAANASWVLTVQVLGSNAMWTGYWPPSNLTRRDSSFLIRRSGPPAHPGTEMSTASATPGDVYPAASTDARNETTARSSTPWTCDT
jgi:hypothetical protein